MKKIKIIFATLLFASLIISCENDGGSSKIDTKYGAVPNVQKTAGTDSFIDLTAINNGTNINLGFTVDRAVGDVSSMNIVGFYIKSDGTIYKATLIENVTEFPATFNISQANLINAFAELNTTSDFEVGDQLKITTELTLRDGSIQKIINDDGTDNFSSNIATSGTYKVVQSYNVSCPSDLGGTYSVISSGTSTDSGPTAEENPITNYPYTVTITDNGGGNYTISDAFGGLYLLWYDIYGITDADSKGEFNDICGVISGTFVEPFGTDTNITGTVNPDGTLSIHWENGYGDMGDSVYTKIEID